VNGGQPILVCYIRKYVIILGDIPVDVVPNQNIGGDVSPASPAGLTPVAVRRFQLLARWPGTHSRILSAIPRAAQTVLGVYLKRTCSRVTSASSASGILNDYALYKSTHSLIHSLTVSGSDIRWAMCKTATRSRQITMPAPHHSVFTGRMFTVDE